MRELVGMQSENRPSPEWLCLEVKELTNVDDRTN